MRIHGLGLSGRLNEAGKIKIGGKGKEVRKSKGGGEYRLPEKWDHFKITTTERDDAGDYVVDEELMDIIGLEPGNIVNGDGKLTGIPIRLLFDDVERNFPTKLVSYIFGKLNCTGNGKESFKAISNFETPCKCPCSRIEPGYDGDDKCKPFGTFTCIIDGVDLFGKVHTLRTTSANSINGILGGMNLVKTVTKGRLAGVPLVLVLTSKTTTIPGTGTKTTIQVVSICYNGSLVDLRQDAIELYQDEQKYITDIAFDASFKDPEDEKEFVEEYFPGQDNGCGDSDAIDIPRTKGPVKTGADFDEHGYNQNKEKDIPLDTVGLLPRTLDATGTDPQYPIPPMYTPEDLEKMKPVGQYGLLYERMLEETDIGKACKLANRITVHGLKYYLVTNYPDVEFEKTDQKPAILEIVKNVLESVLRSAGKDPQETATRQERGEDDLQPDHAPDPTEKKEEHTREWDSSAPITNDQLRTIITLKKELNTTGKLAPTREVWEKHVAFFLDQAGDPVITAKGLTTVQGDTFIVMLRKEAKGVLPF